MAREGPLTGIGAARRVMPFAVLAGVALASLSITPRPPQFVVVAIIVVIVVGACLGLPWSRLPPWAQGVPPLAFYIPVVLLRGPVGTQNSGFGVLTLLPVLWLSLYAGRRQITVAVIGVAAVFAWPLIYSGQHTGAEWRRAVLWVGLAILVSESVHGLVRELRGRRLAAEQTAERLEGVLGAATEYCVIGTDAAGCIEVFNSGAERMLGWRAAEVIGRSVTMLHVADELEARADEIGMPLLKGLAGLDAGTSERRSWTYVRKDFSTLPVELTMTSMRGVRGEVVGFMGIAEDVTAREASARMLRDSEARLTVVARVFRNVQTGQDARDAIIDGALEATEARCAFLFEPDGAAALTLTRARGSDMTHATISLDETSAVVQTFVSGERLFVADPHTHPAVSRRMLDQLDVASALFEPVVRRGEVVAVLVVAWGVPVHGVEDREASVIAMLADEAAIVLEHADVVLRLEQMASTDPLTGLGNRRAWDQRLTLEMARSARDESDLTVALVDLDHFKAFNDEHGHDAGDDLLAAFAQKAKATLRDVDMLARWGGEEFVLVLPGCGPRTAEVVLARLRAAVPGQQTCSVGFALWDGTESLAALMNRADLAMYEAKANGRDRTVMAGRA